MDPNLLSSFRARPTASSQAQTPATPAQNNQTTPPTLTAVANLRPTAIPATPRGAPARPLGPLPQARIVPRPGQDSLTQADPTSPRGTTTGGALAHQRDTERTSPGAPEGAAPKKKSKFGKNPMKLLKSATRKLRPAKDNPKPEAREPKKTELPFDHSKSSEFSESSEPSEPSEPSNRAERSISTSRGTNRQLVSLENIEERGYKYDVSPEFCYGIPVHPNMPYKREFAFNIFLALDTVKQGSNSRNDGHIESVIRDFLTYKLDNISHEQKIERAFYYDYFAKNIDLDALGLKPNGHNALNQSTQKK